jgi:hypothetical protein
LIIGNDGGFFFVEGWNGQRKAIEEKWRWFVGNWQGNCCCIGLGSWAKCCCIRSGNFWAKCCYIKSGNFWAKCCCIKSSS